MNAILEQHKNAIAVICDAYGVSRLDVFGSATRLDFDPARSDFDFILEFETYGPDSARRFIDFADALEALLGRRVDLVFDRAMKPRFREFVASQREVVLERTDRLVAVTSTTPRWKSHIFSTMLRWRTTLMIEGSSCRSSVFWRSSVRLSTGL